VSHGGGVTMTGRRLTGNVHSTAAPPKSLAVAHQKVADGKKNCIMGRWWRVRLMQGSMVGDQV